MFRRPEYASRHASAPKRHFVLEVLYGVFVPVQGLFEIRQLDRYGIRTVLPRAGLYGILVGEATFIAEGFYVALGIRS